MLHIATSLLDIIYHIYNQFLRDLGGMRPSRPRFECQNLVIWRQFWWFFTFPGPPGPLLWLLIISITINIFILEEPNLYLLAQSTLSSLQKRCRFLTKFNIWFGFPSYSCWAFGCLLPSMAAVPFSDTNPLSICKSLPTMKEKTRKYFLKLITEVSHCHVSYFCVGKCH